ncbi:MAG: BatD family protein [Verrucomicrobiales bacterium]|nr:BatD family protein [Verrucomicrobiales bacterium]
MLCVFFLPLTVRAETGVSATLSRDTVSFGGSAEMQLTVRGKDIGNITLPPVDGLQFEQIGSSRSSNFSFSHGGGVSNASNEIVVQLVIRVVPLRDGTFTIPPVTCVLDGKSYVTPPLTLKALKAGSAPGQPATGGSTAAAGEPPAPAVANRAIFGKITGVPETMYPGQVALATVTFYVNLGAKVQINQAGLPVLKNDGFVTPALRPEQVRQQQDGQYLTVSAVVPLTAIKEGKFELAAEWPLTVAVAAEDEQPGDRNDPFNHPIFRGFFRRQAQKDLTANSDRVAVEVLPLPVDGQPASYGGAIGEFTVSATVEPREVRAGDPLTLKVEVRGHGNFDRIAAPVPAAARGWKAYPASGQFAAADSAGLAGVKTFSLPLIPRDDTIKQLPDVEFSYFDPLTVQYITLRPELPAITVLPAEPGAARPATSAAASGGGNAPALAPLRLTAGAPRAELRPVTRRAWFWALNGGSLLLGLAGIGLLWNYRRVSDHEYQRQRRAGRNIDAALRALDTALANEDSAAFAAAACRALRERLAGLWQVRAASITTADARRRLGADGETIAALFAAADAVTYAGRRFSREEMTVFKQQVAEQLKRLEL